MSDAIIMGNSKKKEGIVVRRHERRTNGGTPASNLQIPGLGKSVTDLSRRVCVLV